MGAAMIFQKISIMSLKLSILAPDRIFWNASAFEIILPTQTGQMGVLPNHTPTMTGLDIGVMLVRSSNSSEWTSMVLQGGFALIQDNKVTILVNDAELGSNIDQEKAQASLATAQAQFDSAVSRGDLKEKIEASLAQKRARAQLSASLQAGTRV